MEFDYYSPSETFVVLTADQFVGRDDGLLEQQKQDSHVCRRNFSAIAAGFQQYLQIFCNTCTFFAIPADFLQYLQIFWNIYFFYSGIFFCRHSVLQIFCIFSAYYLQYLRFSATPTDFFAYFLHIFCNTWRFSVHFL